MPATQPPIPTSDDARTLALTVLEAWPDADGAARVTALFRETFGAEPDGVWAAPGRVNLIGEHVDYNGGLCLPMALPHRTFVALRRRTDDRVRLVSALHPDDVWEGTVADLAPGQVRGFIAYAGGPAWVLCQEGFDVGGFEMADASCVPSGAGLSSSAAIESSVAVALDDTHGLGLAATDAGRARLARSACRRHAPPPRGQAPPRSRSAPPGQSSLPWPQRDAGQMARQAARPAAGSPCRALGPPPSGRTTARPPAHRRRS